MHWKGFKQFRIIKKVQEDSYVTSFYLQPVDGVDLPDHIPGQFIAVRIPKGNQEYSKIRQYTISNKSGDNFYRISVKFEEDGDVSIQLCNELDVGDIIEATAPLGTFVLKESTNPLVLIGGGIGITPMISMAYDAVEQNRDIFLVYSVKNSDYHGFKEEIDALSQETERLNVVTIYTRPRKEDDQDSYQQSGRISKEWLRENIPLEGDFYFCGPNEFMKSVYQNLIDLGVQKQKINYEMFQPGSNITD